jgi:hypothetical protein
MLRREEKSQREGTAKIGADLYAKKLAEGDAVCEYCAVGQI